MSTPEPSPDPHKSPLHDRHVVASAVFTDFAGWQMPLRYTSDLAEHHAVRSAAGIFDLSHMAEIRVSGPGALSLLDTALAGTFGAMPVGRAKYSLILNDRGGIVDDVIVYRLGEEIFLVVANASNRFSVLDALTLPREVFDVRVTDETEQTALIAIQGPQAEQILAAIESLDEQPDHPLHGLRYYRCASALFNGSPVLVARTGYTGEDGFELYVESGAAGALWDAVLDAAADRGGVPCGLACRDTLRLEAGMPLYGHELSDSVTPAQAGLGRAVAAEKAQLAAPAPGARVLVGLRGEGRRAPRAGYPVHRTADLDGVSSVGEITSGALSPTLGYPIAMAYLDPDLSTPGTELFADVRGTRLPVTVTELPFYRREKDNT